MYLLIFGQRTAIAILLFAISSPLLALPRTQKPSGELFAYDRLVAHDLKVESSKEQSGVVIQDVSYAAYTQQRGRIKAYLIKPAAGGPFAGVLYFHWYGTPNGNRNQFLAEALALASQGTVSLLIQGYFPWEVAPTDAKTDRQRVIDETIEVRRALDLLISQPRLDRKRIGFVGHDYGAMYGANVSGVEKRVKAYVFTAGLGNFGDWSLKYWPVTASKGEEVYRQTLNAVDPINHVPRAAPAALLFQFANTDKYIPKTAATQFFDAASKPKHILWYDAEHELNVEAARNDRREWLTRQLGLAQLPRAAGASVEQMIRRMEEEGRQATLKNDVEATERLLADDWMNTNANGTVTTKPQLIALLKSSPFSFISIEDEEVMIRSYEGAAAVVTGRSVRKRSGSDGKVIAQQFRFTRVYVNRAGRWQVVAAQSTPILQP